MSKYDSQITAVLQQIADAEQELQRAVAHRNSHQARAIDWGYGTPQYNESNAEYHRGIEWVNRVTVVLADLRTQLEALRNLQAEVGAAAAAAIASGMTEEAAFIKAESDADRARIVNNIIKWVAIGTAIVMVVIGIGMVRKWRKKKG